MRIDKMFLVLAIVCLLVGISLGIYMGVREDFQFAPVHGHINLVGWVSLALFAVIYRVYPELSHSRSAWLHFCLAAPSAPLLPIGIYLAMSGHSPALAIVASLGWLSGTLVFFVAVLRFAILIKKPSHIAAQSE
jgi:hypothetical protein